jgi:hypothetical protein
MRSFCSSCSYAHTVTNTLPPAGYSASVNLLLRLEQMLPLYHHLQLCTPDGQHGPTWAQDVAQPLQQPQAPCNAGDVMQHCNAQHAIAAGGPVGQRKSIRNCHICLQLMPCKYGRAPIVSKWPFESTASRSLPKRGSNQLPPWRLNHVQAFGSSCKQTMRICRPESVARRRAATSASPMLRSEPRTATS